MTDRWVSVRVVAARLGYSMEHVRRLIRAGKIPATRIARGNLRIRQSFLDAFRENKDTATRYISDQTD